MNLLLKLILFINLFCYSILSENLRLYPKESETREVKNLDGIWNFRVIPAGVDQNIGFNEKWYLKPLTDVRKIN